MTNPEQIEADRRNAARRGLARELLVKGESNGDFTGERSCVQNVRQLALLSPDAKEESQEKPAEIGFVS